MRTRDISEREAAQICKRDEGHFFERKGRDASGKQMQKIATAFANADGGELMVGIKDDKHEVDASKRWDGAKRLEELNGHLQSLFDIKPTLDLRYEVLTCAKRKGSVLRVIVEKGSQVHYTSDGSVYQRYGAQSLLIKSADRIAALSFAKGASSFEDQAIKVEPEEVVDSPALSDFLAGVAPTMEPLDYCLNENLLDLRTWEPRVAGMLLFHKNPSAFVPRKCAVKIARYETKEEEPDRDQLVKQETVEGPLIVQIRTSISKIQQIMKSVTIRTADGLKNVDYPPEAVWEVLVNAIIHRDYSISDDVQVFIYDNRIEILSPGRLPGYVTVENILDARYSRNPKIVRNLARYEEAPNKDLGEGLNTTFQKMKEWGLKDPIISEDKSYVRVILPHTPLAAPTEAILRFLLSHPTITNMQAREITGIKSENLVKIEFYKLRDEGFLERVPNLKGPKSAWRLTAPGKREAKRFK